MRGRPRNKGPNPLTRSYESNGPDVKIRGTAQHIADKYAQLARDATASGDPVSAENYHQHAEHYYRLIAAAQEAYRQQFGTPQRPFDEDGEEGDEDGAQQNGPYGYSDRQGGAPGGDEFGEGPAQGFDPRGGNDRQGFDPRAGGDRQGGRYEGEGRPDRNERGQDRGGERPRYDRTNGQDRNQRFDRNNGQDRNQRFDRGDRGQGGERFDRSNGPGERGFDRGNGQGERYERGVNGGGQGERYGQQSGFDRPDRPEGRQEGPQGRQDRPEGRDRNGGRDGGRRDFNRDRQPRGPEGQRFQAPEDAAEAPAANLPAFLTNPVRTPITMGDAERSDPILASAPPSEDGEFGAPLNGPPEARARRTRRPRRPEGEAPDLGLGDTGEKPAE